MNVKLKWTPELAVNFKELDNHHKKLFDIINQIVADKKNGAEESALLQVLQELIKYSGYHFREEDEFMVENDYPLFMSHRKEHQSYTQKMGEFITSFEQGDVHLFNSIIKFLAEWWLKHISESDLKYSRYIHANQSK